MAKKTIILILLFLLLGNGAFELDGHWIGLNWPLQGAGVRSSPFGNRTHPILDVVRAHGGVDVAAPKGTPVLAALGGRVVRVGAGGDLGNSIVIEHPNERQTIYGHLSSVGVKNGQFVSPRQIIGKVGSTGLSTGPHLHFAVKQNGKFVNPEKWMVPTGYLKIRK